MLPRANDETAHVEHFKAELGREVAVMTQDVGRLHQEKQAIEQQIADLFAFYSKQKQEAEVRLPFLHPFHSSTLHLSVCLWSEGV